MSCLSLKLKNHMYKLFISVAVFGFVQSSYTVGEDNGSVQVCVQLKEEKLGSELTLKLQTHWGTAKGNIIMCLHVLVFKTTVHYNLIVVCPSNHYIYFSKLDNLCVLFLNTRLWREKVVHHVTAL